MSTSSKQTLNLGENQLAKLTHEAPEIRMRALEQVETRFMRGLQYDENLNFKPIRFLKQLIGWFNFKPPVATERVLSLMLELMRSDYGDEIAARIPAQRLLDEVAKMQKLLLEYPSERSQELLEDLKRVFTMMHLDAITPVASSCCSHSSDDQLSDDCDTDYTNSRDRLRLTPSDYEHAWTRPSDTDMLTMRTINDSLNVNNELDLIRNLTNLQIKLCDYPIEYFLQPPDVYLMLIHIQRMSTGEVLPHINRVMFAFLKQLQQRHSVRSKTLSYATRIEPPMNSKQLPDQLRFRKALTILLYGSIKRLGPPLLEDCGSNWHCIELIVEAINTMNQLGVRVPDYIVHRMGIMVPKLLIYLRSIEVSSPGYIRNYSSDMMIPRLESLVFNGLLMNVIAINVQHNPNIDKAMARSMLQPILTDEVYLTCFPAVVQELSNLCAALNSDAEALRKQMCRLKVAYSTALNQLVAKTQMQPLDLLRNQRKVCLVLNQMGSKTLLRQLVEAIVKGTPCYGQQRELRQEAECLLSTLFDLPDVEMRGHALRLLKQPVVDHFHAFMNHTNYMAGCSNIELARMHILGLPMSSHLVRKLLVQGWMPQQPKAAQVQLQQWCIDYLIMLLGLSKLIGSRDFAEAFKMLLPVVPLMICRAVNYPQLQQVIWDLVDPDKRYVDRNVALRANACYLFHPDAMFRKEAINRVAYVLMRQDTHNKYRNIMDQLTLDLIGHDLCVIQPPIDYSKLFSEPMTQSVSRSLLALQRLLETPDLKPGIRKSTLVQLNVLLHNWQAVEAFTNNEGAHLLCLNALHDPLLRKRQPSAMDTELLKPATSILLRVLFRSERIRQDYKYDMLVCPLRCLFIVPHDARLRAELSCCIFQLLYQDHMTPTETQLIMNVNLSPLIVPVSYQEDHVVPPTAATEGIALQDHLLAKHFLGDKELAAQHWRLYIAQRICKSPENMQLSAVQGLDMLESLKLTPTDLAFVHTTLVYKQLEQQLLQANNSSSHQMLLHYVGSLQLFLVVLRGNVPQPHDETVWTLMHKYLRNSPSNGLDRRVYFALLELCHSCLRHRLPAVLTGLSTALETDPHHCFFAVLRDLQVDLQMLQLVSSCLVQLLHTGDRSEECEWHGRLFMELSKLARSHFELRRLQHVRCLLAVLRQLSSRPLNMTDITLQAHYQHFVQLSSNLRTSTQTGAQWQRDCLLIMCQLQAQAHCPAVVAVSTGHGIKVLRYLLGLCGHGDAEVRTLAWVTLANWLKSSDCNMASVLLEFRDFLPGGLAACCLATMLDAHEQMLVRELAGRVFERLMPHIGASVCVELLCKYAFLQEAHAALATLELSPELSDNVQGVRNSCEIIACYVSICIRLVHLQPSWCTTLCEHAFLHALSDVMKLKTPDRPHCNGYMELCAGHICKLYALCYDHNFEFLQRSICRDTVLLTEFFALTNTLLDQKVVPEKQLEEVLKLMMVFCKDANAYRVLYDHFKKHPEMIMDILIYGCNLALAHRPVQRYTLTWFSLLLTKTQHEPKDDNLLRALENFGESFDVDEADDDNANDDENTMNSDSDEECIKRLKIMNLKPTIKPKPTTGNSSKKPPASVVYSEITNAAVLLFHTFDHMFEMYYPVKTYSFLQGPTRHHLQLCEVMGNLLKMSPIIVEAARSAQLLERIIQMVESFLDDPSVGNASAYVRRVGAHKTREIINNLMLIFNMLLHWHSNSSAFIIDAVMVSRFVRVILRLWPWLSHSGVLKHMILCLTTHLTEHSFEMCKQASQVLSNQSHSLLQLMMRVADHETTKKDTPLAKPNACSVLVITPNSFVESSLRVMINCSSCAEGRLSLAKMRVLDMFDTILPGSHGNQNKVRPEALLSWLCFWEIYSRYDPGNKVCHMTALLDTVRRSPPLSMKRMTCLRILRNMCFANSNRTQLIGMHEFQNLLLSILMQPVQIDGGAGDAALNSYEEQWLVILCLWKLFGFTAKHRALLRSSKMFKQTDKLWDELTKLDSENRKRYLSIPFAKDTSDMLNNLYAAVQI
ncbi:hypothetical protein KR044_000386 [Drosophila immigrans]|nr:hypothetical protein KR044_000386 [Drosophila immigrans]